MSLSTALVCFIVCHGGPADHFAAFAENLPKDAYQVQVYATGPALKKFQEGGIAVTMPFSLDTGDEDKLAEHLAKQCSTASFVLTDVGHPFDIKLQQALAKHAGNVTRYAYYDNPEPYVPGGYSAVAAEVMLASQGVLFANSNLANKPIYRSPNQEVVLPHQKRIGIGYYPVNQADKIAKRREIEHQNHPDRKVLVYFGGNNDEYFEKAFPAFLSILAEAAKQSDLSHLLILIQQHPGAKAKNFEGPLISTWSKENHAVKVMLSDLTSDDAQVAADLALYYQTSMAPQLILAGIPTVQIGHETYDDILVRNNLAPSVTTARQFVKAIEKQEVKQEPLCDRIFQSLGIRSDWLEVLEKTIQ